MNDNYIIEIIENNLIDDMYLKEEELKEELYTIEPDVLINILRKLYNEKKFDILYIIWNSIETSYINRYIKKFDDFINDIEYKRIISDYKNRTNKSKTLKYKLNKDR